MNIIGKRVKHDTLGLGIITRIDNERIFIRFDKQGKESKFAYPVEFAGHLSFLDLGLQRQIKALAEVKLRRNKQSANTIKKIGEPEKEKDPGGFPPPPPPKPVVKSKLNSYTGTGMLSSSIMLATIKGAERDYDILIVKDDKQQDSKKGIYWKNRELAKKIMEAHFSGEKRFEFDGAEYTVGFVKQGAYYAPERRKWDKFNDIKQAKDLYVFKQKGIYDNPEEGYELVDARLYFPDKLQAIKVAMYYETKTSRFFLNEETFNPLVRAHGMPKIRLHYVEETSTTTGWGGTFKLESKLKKLGYSVQKADGMTDGERQTLLSSIIRSGQMSDTEIVNHLEMLIHMNSGKTNMTDACGCWRADLKFVQDNFGDMRKQHGFR